MGIYLTNQAVANPGDYGTNVTSARGLTDASLNLSIVPPPLPPDAAVERGPVVLRHHQRERRGAEQH